MGRKKSQLLVNRYPDGMSAGGKMIQTPWIGESIELQYEFFRTKYFKILEKYLKLREKYRSIKNKFDYDKNVLLLANNTSNERLLNGIDMYKELVGKYNNLVKKSNQLNEKLVISEKKNAKLQEQYHLLKQKKLCDTNDEYKKLFNQYCCLKKTNEKLLKEKQYLLDNAVFTKHSATIHPQ